MSAIDNLNTKPIKEVLTEVRERFSTRANWQTNSLSSSKGCMCLLGAMSVAEGIVTPDDYLNYHNAITVDDFLNNNNLSVGEFEDQAAIYRAMADSRALEFLMEDIATDNDNIAFAIKTDKDGLHYVDAAWTFNDGHDMGSYRDKEVSYHRLLNALDHAIARA